jgi:hypothetical protein
MLINHAIEFARRLRRENQLLRERARAAQRRLPLILIPPMLGTKLRGHDGRSLWGTTRSVFFGSDFGGDEEVRLDGVLDGFLLVPGLYSHDIHGGLIRYLQRVGGYRLDEDLFVLQYDWRQGVVEGAANLAALVRRIKRAPDERMDLACVSSGGLLARYFLAYGDRDVLDSDEPPLPTAAGAHEVRRVVYMGTPHRGSLEALAVLQEGFRLVPLGRHFTARDAARSQLTYELLPHPDDPVLIDGRGGTFAIDLYDADAWQGFGLIHHDPQDLARRLRLARRLHRSLDLEFEHPEAIVIGARHVSTRTRMLLEEGHARLVDCCGNSSATDTSMFMEPGDGSVSERSMLGLPGHDAKRVCYVTPAEHRWLPSDPDVHRLALEALLQGEQ